MATLFATPPARPLTPARFALGSVLVLLGAAISLLRQPGAGALNTLWAEDGSIFLSQAARHSTIDALTTSYAGYYHLVPRLLAEVATLFPASAAAAVIAIEAALCTSLLALLVYVASGGLLRSPLPRVLVSAVVVLVPVGQQDVLNSIANFHWFGLYALFWVLLWMPRTRAGRIVAAVTVLAVAGSDILVLVYLPLVLVRAVSWPADHDQTLNRFRLRLRDRHSALLAGLFGLGLLMQLAGLATGQSSRHLDPNPVRAATGFVLRAVPVPLIGERWLGTATITSRWLLLAAVAWILVGLAVVAAWAGLTRPNWPLAIAATLQSAVLYMLSVALSGVATGRYSVAPAMLVVVALVALLQPSEAAARWSRSAAPIYALTALLALICAANLRVDNLRADGPQWNTAIREAKSTCESTHSSTVDIRIPPITTETWTVTLPCTALKP